jgi:hypothetical protein
MNNRYRLRVDRPKYEPLAALGLLIGVAAPIVTGSRMPTAGKPTHRRSVAKPQLKTSALIRNATSAGEA